MSAKDWATAIGRGSFAGDSLDLQHGFIHLSAAHQVAETLRLYFPGRNDLLETGSFGWIPMGRDVSLEQKILANLNGRLTEILPSGNRLPINGGSVPVLQGQ